MLRKRTLERKLFGWLLILGAVPALAVLLVALGLGSRSLEWFGTLGAWTEVGESGQALLAAIDQDSTSASVAGAAARHRANLSESLGLANRWTYLGSRLTAAAPVVVGLFALLLAGLAAVVARRLARELARPIEELTAWAPAMAEGEALPAAKSDESSDVAEVRALRDAMRTAAHEIGAARARAVETERTRVWGEMARRVAHEMKNPLTPLRLAARRLSAGAVSNGALADAVAVIDEETTRLDDLARSFALLGRPPVGPATEIDLSDMLGRLLESDVPSVIERSLDAPESCAIQGHYDALLRTFRNLLRNAVEAVQAVDRPGRIEVRIQMMGDDIEIVVSDNGIGIPAGAEEVIFEPDRTWKTSGTGLGLAVVQQVVVSHGGRVNARARPGGGTDFVVRMPAGDRSTGHAASASMGEST